jgi:hypothetical protein
MRESFSRKMDVSLAVKIVGGERREALLLTPDWRFKGMRSITPFHVAFWRSSPSLLQNLLQKMPYYTSYLEGFILHTSEECSSK